MMLKIDDVFFPNLLHCP